MRSLALFSLLSSFAFVAGPVAAADETVGEVSVAETYAITIAGIDIGDATLTVDALGPDYDAALTGDYRFLFWSGAIEAQAAGKHSAGGVGFAPATYRSRVDSPTRIFTTDILFAGASTEGRWRADPPFEDRDTVERVPIKPEHLTGAKDPLSAFLVPAESGEAACAGTLKVYSGVVRFDLDLRAIGAAKSASDDAVECAVSYRPVSGHRVESDEVNRLERDGLSISVFEIAPGLWAPERVGFSTMFGTLALTRR
ncbi:MAG: hypothetical protein AAF360_08460 [Pseudomonadota bacterium]